MHSPWHCYSHYILCETVVECLKVCVLLYRMLACTRFGFFLDVVSELTITVSHHTPNAFALLLLFALHFVGECYRMLEGVCSVLRPCLLVLGSVFLDVVIVVRASHHSFRFVLLI